MARRFTTVLARLGTRTGDGRVLAPGGITSRELPLPLMWQEVSEDGHGGSRVVGRLESVQFGPDMVTGTGSILDSAEWSTVVEQIEAGVIGPSVDLDDVEYSVMDNGDVVITSGRIAGATLVAIPAFEGVSITLDPLPAPSAVYETYHAEVMTFATQAQTRLEGTEGTRSLPPAEWFRAPDVDRLTPITVSDTGRVFGHIAGWGTCHVGLPGCVTPPRSATDYAYFHVSPQPTREGGRIAVGTLVTGPRHADPQLAFQAAAQHYDDLDCAVAKVVAGEDEHGIWVAGWMVPGASEAKVAQFMSSPVSGDWRRVAGGLELIAVCSVNTPGFPVRARVGFALQEQNCLIASTGVMPVQGYVEGTEGTSSLLPELDDSLALWAWADTEV